MAIKEVQIAGQKLMVQELDDVCDPVTGRILTGSWVWNCSLFLSEWITTQVQPGFNLQGKTVLELGAGMGIPGLTVALLGAGRVILTNIGQLLPGLQENVELNELGDGVDVCGLDNSLMSQGDGLGEVDIVLMSDVFYDVVEMEALAKTLMRMCGVETRVWAASEVRPWTGECLGEFMRQGFEVVELVCSIGEESLMCSEMMDEYAKRFSVFDLSPL